MQKREINAIELGGSLYIPAIHKNLLPVCTASRYPALRSCIVCTEDSILESDLPQALNNLQALLDSLDGTQPLKIFFRPRNLNVLEAMLKQKGIEKIDGFVLPKFDTENMDAYLALLEPHAEHFFILPVIESRDMFETSKLQAIRKRLLRSPLDTLTIRIGGEDMLRHFGLKKDCDTSIYDLVGAASVLGDILKTFKPYGFFIAAPVYTCIRRPENFSREIVRDLQQGFIGKTIIHPDQIGPINECYKVSQEDLAMAEAMLDTATPAIIEQNGQMGEKFAHDAWAATILARAKYYGIIESSI